MLEQELQQMLWRIHFNDVEFLKRRAGSIVSDAAIFYEYNHVYYSTVRP